MVLCSIYLLVLCWQIVVCMSGDARDVVIDTELKLGENIKHIGPEFVHVALIVTNYVDIKTGDENKKLSLHMNNLLESILTFSTGKPLHFMIIPDDSSNKNIAKVRRVLCILRSNVRFVI